MRTRLNRLNASTRRYLHPFGDRSMLFDKVMFSFRNHGLRACGLFLLALPMPASRSSARSSAVRWHPRQGRLVPPDVLEGIEFVARYRSAPVVVRVNENRGCPRRRG